jgi:hypothetical protein
LPASQESFFGFMRPIGRCFLLIMTLPSSAAYASVEIIDNRAPVRDELRLVVRIAPTSSKYTRSHSPSRATLHPHPHSLIRAILQPMRLQVAAAGRITTV